jgi:hypothetical protein
VPSGRVFASHSEPTDGKNQRRRSHAEKRVDANLSRYRLGCCLSATGPKIPAEADEPRAAGGEQT